jgi:D-lactate dehydrogenase
MKILVYSSHSFNRPFLEKEAKGKCNLSFTEKHLNEETVSLANGFDVISLFTSDNASLKVLELLKTIGVKYISLQSVGHDHIDLKKATQLGIKVANVPSYSPYSVAEHAVTLLLALNRKLLLSQELAKQNDFRLDNLVGFDLHGKTVGIVGTGKIGSTFAKIMNGFGCKLIGYDIKQNSELIKQTGLSYVTLEELCRYSDVISIHCPLNSSTKYLFNKNIFNSMKKGVFFINTARGAIVNTIDLIKALEEGIVAAAGLDVYENEKEIFFHNHSGSKIKDEVFNVLRTNSKVLITGHQAFLTNEALKDIAETTVSNITEWSQKGFSKNDLN